jgi:CelD/BcsL family acetyltransferase involved in cellulose biosynthesis
MRLYSNLDDKDIFPVRITPYTTLDSFRSLRAEWDELLPHSISNRVFSTFDWQLTWWEAYTPGELWVIAVRNDDDKLLGIAPWFVQTHNDERVIRSIGCVDVTDYVDLIVNEAYAETVCGALAEFLPKHRDHFDRINLCNIPEQSPTLAYLPTLLTEAGLLSELELQEVCPVIPLPPTFEAYLESLDKKERHEIRRKMRRAAGESQDLSWYIVGAEHDFEQELNRFITLMAASQPAKAEFLADPQNDAFLRQIARIMYRCGWLQLSFLRINGEAIATYMNFDYANQIQVYNSGLALDRYSHLSAGIVLLAYNIQHAIETGHTLFDFLRGNEVYKYRMGAQDTKVFKLKAQPTR